MPRPHRDQRRERGDQTRQRILSAAADLASTQGLEALTLGALADRLDMSRSGIVKHFGSREQLQLETIAYAADVFASVVLADSLALSPGLARLHATLDNWLDYLTDSTFSGGCFFYSTSSELDRQPGPLREALVTAVQTGMALLREDLVAAVGSGDLRPDVDPDQLLFELHAYLLEVSSAYLLLQDRQAHERGARAISSALERAVRA